MSRGPRWGVLLAIAAAMVAAKVPLSFLALLACPLVVIVVNGLRRRAPLPQLLRWLCAWGLVASIASAMVTNPAALASTSSNFMMVLAFTLVAGAVFLTGRPQVMGAWVVNGLYLGLLGVWGLSMFEIASGIKMLPLLYPTANTAAVVASDRFFVSAFFPNYNDYCVAMVQLSLVVVARMLFQPRVSGRRRLGRWVVLLSCTFLITYMGSRGALIGLVVGMAILAICSIRQVRPGAIGLRTVALTGLVMVVGAVGIFLSPYVQDHSTAQRGQIATNIGTLFVEQPGHALIGWDSYTDYQAAAQTRFGAILMDPHNLLLEFAVRFGLPAMLLYIALWWWVTRRGVLLQRIRLDWRTASAVAVTALMPVLGVVSSSTLRYHTVVLWLIAAVVAIRWGAPRKHQGVAPEIVGPVSSDAAQPVASSASAAATSA